MKVKIISPVVNIPSFLNIQISKFKENLLCDFELICIDDSRQEGLDQQFRNVCSDHDDVATWFKNTRDPVSGPSMGHASAIQFALDNIVSPKKFLLVPVTEFAMNTDLTFAK